MEIRKKDPTPILRRAMESCSAQDRIAGYARLGSESSKGVISKLVKGVTFLNCVDRKESLNSTLQLFGLEGLEIFVLEGVI